MKISLKKLEAALALVIEHIKKEDGEDIVIEMDFYRWIDHREFFNVSEINENDFAVGQISDDLFRLEKILSRESEPSVADLSTLAAIMIGIQSELLRPFREP